jgi:hypothetical protein
MVSLTHRAYGDESYDANCNKLTPRKAQKDPRNSLVQSLRRKPSAGGEAFSRGF